MLCQSWDPCGHSEGRFSLNQATWVPGAFQPRGVKKSEESRKRAKKSQKKATCEKEIRFSLKRHPFLHGDRVKMLAQGFSDLFFDAAPPLSRIFFQFFELSTKAAFAKAAFHTLRLTLLRLLGVT